MARRDALPGRWLARCALALLAPAAIGAAACGGASRRGAETLLVAGDRPRVATVLREGDPQNAVAVAVMTAGIDPERGAEPAMALAALVESRLAARWPEATVIPSWDGYRVRGGVTDDPAARIDAIRWALLAPLSAAELPIVQRKLGALAQRPLRDAALRDFAQCRGEPFGLVPPTRPATPGDVERWRSEAHVLGRVALAVTGVADAANAAIAALNRAPAWPQPRSLPPARWPDGGDAPVIYDAPDEPSGNAHATVLFRSPDPVRVVAAAEALADARGPLASRLEGFEGSARVREIVSTAHANGGCLGVTLDFRDLGQTPAARLAAAVAMVRQEVTSALADAKSLPAAEAGMALARRAGDPREAAERAAWWSLVNDPPSPTSKAAAAPAASMRVAVGIAPPRDSAPPKAGAESGPVRLDARAMQREIERAVSAAREKVVEVRSRVERGQSDLWLLVASPCGTLPEVEADAGLGAAFALLATEQGRARAEASVELAPWASFEAVGVIAHGPARDGESPSAHAHRIADAAARSFAAEPLDGALAARARSALLAAVDDTDDHALVALANGVVPGRPSWLSPGGSVESIARASDGALAARATSIRGGPIRVAILANVDDTQAAAVVESVDRWVLRRADDARACPAVSSPPPPRPGTYAVPYVGTFSEAWIGAPLPRGDARARPVAEVVAHALGGSGGLLARALLDTGLAHAADARVVGPVEGGALVVRIASAEGALDAAVAQTRALLDRLRRQGLDAKSLERAHAARARAREERDLAPAQRLLALFRGDPRPDGAAPSPLQRPSADAVRSFVGQVLRDDTFVLVAARPPRPAKNP